MKARIIAIIIVICLGLTGSVQALGAKSSSDAGLPIQEIYPDQDLVEDLSTFITAQMQAAKVPGLSIALIQEGQDPLGGGVWCNQLSHRETGGRGYRF